MARVPFNVRAVYGRGHRGEVERRIAALTNELAAARGGSAKLRPEVRTRIERAAHLQAMVEYAERQAQVGPLSEVDSRALDRLRNIATDAIARLKLPGAA